MTYEDLKSDLDKLFDELSISKGENIYVTGNISKFARTRILKSDILRAITNSLIESITPLGTIFSPSASMNLCNSDIVFDLAETPSHEMGPLAEFLRLQENSVRSFHPFWSISGLGKKAELLKDVSRHSYGLFSPWSYFLDLNVRQINFGIHPSKAVTLIHHVETAVGVPYRYTKEFIHPVIRNKKEIMEPFYMSVLYKDTDITKRIKLNEHYFEILTQRRQLHYVKHKSGIDIWSFKMSDFFNAVEPIFKRDIYNYLEHEPTIRPYQH